MQERISIEEAIREAGLKKKYVANELGVSETYINEYLKKPGSISVKNASIICKLINVNYIYVQEISRLWIYSRVFFVYSTELNIFLSLYISFDSKAIYDKGIVYIFCLGRRRWEHMKIVLS